MVEVKITVGRVTLQLGSPQGTRADPAADPDPDQAEAVREALERAPDPLPPDGAVDAVERATERAGEVTAGIERASEIATALSRGVTLDPQTLQTQLNALLDVLDRADRDGRWEDELRLARALAALLALIPRWLALATTLKRALAAAQALGDRAGAGWAHHELGTFSIGADDAHAATGHLNEAVRIRESIGDRAGAEASRHNLRTLAAVSGGGSSWTVPRAVALASAVVAALALAGGLAFAGGLIGGDEGDETTAAVETAPGETTETVPTEAENSPPIAEDLELEATEDEPAEWEPEVDDADDDELRCTAQGETDQGGSATVDDDCGSGDYTPEPNFSGTDRFVYEVADGQGRPVEAVVIVEVEPVNDPPVAEPLVLSTDEDTPVEWAPTVSDVDDQELVCSIPDPEDAKRATVSPNCSEGTYTPSLDFNGDDAFTYEVRDPAGETGTALVRVTVLPVDDIT